MDHVWWGFGLLTLSLVTLTLARAARLGLGVMPVTAVLRAVLQLSGCLSTTQCGGVAVGVPRTIWSPASARTAMARSSQSQRNWPGSGS